MFELRAQLSPVLQLPPGVDRIPPDQTPGTPGVEQGGIQ